MEDVLEAAMIHLERHAAESDRRFHSVLACLPGIFYRCEPGSPWTMSFISEGIEQLTGYTAEELGSRSGWADIMLPEDRDAVETGVEKSLEENRTFEVTYRILGKGGDLRWVSERGHAIRDPAGAPLFLEGVITDISGRKQAEELQQALVANWQTTLDAIPQMVWVLAADGSGRFCNEQWVAFTGRPMTANSLDLSDLLHPEDKDRAFRDAQESLATGVDFEGSYRLKHASGTYRSVLSRGHAQKDSVGRVIGWYGTCTDVHEYAEARRALQASEAVNRTIVEASPDCISLLDAEGRVQLLNEAALTALGLTSFAHLVGKPWPELFPVSVQGAADVALRQARQGRKKHFSVSETTANGLRWWDMVLAPIRHRERQTGILTIARDITHQKVAEERVRWAANHDSLTLLPNRALFQQILDGHLSEAAEKRETFAVLMMDLDDFKRTNDALGHDAGDALLSEFARRLRQVVRKDDLVARLGGDEFALLLRSISGKEDIAAAVGAILDELKNPFIFNGKVLDIKTSIGASTYPEHGSARGELLKHADIALYVAKAAGRGVLRIFEPAMRADAQHRASMLSLAKDALSSNRIVPFYQPKVDLLTNRLDGFEALLRWRHPSRGMQTPDTIAAAFDDVNLAAEISDRMIDAVIADIRRWKDRDTAFGHVAVNAAAAEFRRGDFAEKLLEQLYRAQIPSDCIQVEVTETVFLGRGSEHVEDALKTLSAAGIQIALDDFGTGYASLSHLNKFPVNVIKIDRSFIERLQTSEPDASIVRAVINLGRSLGIKIVAEGVENSEQAAFLKKHRCHYGQGFLFGKAQPADCIAALVENWIRNH